MSLPPWLEKQVSEAERRRREIVRRVEEPIYAPPRIPELHKSGNPNAVEAEAFREMMRLTQGTALHGAWAKLLESALWAFKSTVSDATARRVFIQDLAASLNRKGLVSRGNVQFFREYGYMYMRGFR